MAAINNYSIQDFSDNVKAKLNVASQDSNLSVDDKIQEYFQNLAQNDGGENPNEYEATRSEFMNAVKNCVDMVTSFVKDTAQNFTEFIAGNSKTKKNGSLTPDEVHIYENGNLTKVTTGFDYDDSKTIEGNEVYTEFIAGNSKTKQNGAITPDRENFYDLNGNLIDSIEGFDDNGNHQIDPDEIIK
jgi:hypothetical protein